MSKRSTLNIEKEAYEEIKEFCNENSYKISAWAQKVLKEEIEKIKNENS